MKWFRKSLLWLSVVGSFGTAMAQEQAWQDRAPTSATPRGISLGRPSALPGGAVDTTSPTTGLRLIAASPGPAAVTAAATVHAPAGTVAPPDWESPPRAGNASDVLRLMSFADMSPRGSSRSEEPTGPVIVSTEIPVPAVSGPPSVRLEPRPETQRWFYRPALAMQPMPEPGANSILPPVSGPDINVFVAPPPQPIKGPITGEPAPTLDTNPWTGAPLEGAVMDPVASGPLPEGLTDDLGGIGGGGPTQGYRFYGSAEYLLWWVRGFYLPPLVTTGPATVNEDIRGALGAPGTTLLFGNTNTPSGPISGARFTAGWFLGPCSPWAVEVSGFFLGRQTGDFNTNSAQNPVIARPFFNVNTGMFDRELTATPGILPTDAFMLRGAIDVHSTSQLWGLEANLKRILCCGCNYNLSGLVGFRYLDLREGLTITENVTSLAAVQGTNVFDPGNQITVVDSFQTHNRFYGGQLGLQGEVRRGRWFLGGNVKLGIGQNHETITISGSQTVETLAGMRQTFNGGLLALPSNSGTFSRDQISFVPQVGLKVGYALTTNLRVFFGYDFLYWTNVVRPGDQIDLALNTSQIPNFNIPPAMAPASNQVRPIVPFHSTGFWAQGINAGLEFRY
jgi:hypothetical protein